MIIVIESNAICFSFYISISYYRLIKDKGQDIYIYIKRVAL